MNLDKIKENLIDAKCNKQDISEIEKLFSSGDIREALRKIKMARCLKIDEMHDCCKQIDCLDYLIRETEKENVKN